jgi:hypothetical protein
MNQDKDPAALVQQLQKEILEISDQLYVLLLAMHGSEDINSRPFRLNLSRTYKEVDAVKDTASELQALLKASSPSK